MFKNTGSLEDLEIMNTLLGTNNKKNKNKNSKISSNKKINNNIMNEKNNLYNDNNNNDNNNDDIKSNNKENIDGWLEITNFREIKKNQKKDGNTAQDDSSSEFIDAMLK